MGILLGPDKYDNALIWISLHLNMLLILNLVLMPTNDNEARSESTNPSTTAIEAAPAAIQKNKHIQV